MLVVSVYVNPLLNVAYLNVLQPCRWYPVTHSDALYKDIWMGGWCHLYLIHSGYPFLPCRHRLE